MKAVYPIILTPAERGYVVFVPDLDINTEGEDLADAIEMARDAIGLWGITEEDAGREIPQASGTMPHPEEQEIVTLVDIDFAAYRRANDLRTVRKKRDASFLAERPGGAKRRKLFTGITGKFERAPACKQPVKE